MRQASVIAIAVKLDDGPAYSREILAQFAEEMEASIDSAIDSK